MSDKSDFSSDIFPGLNGRLSEDIILGIEVEDYLKAEMDIEEVISDPDYQRVTEEAISMIAGFSEDSAGNRKNKSFISQSLKESKGNDALKNVDRIRKEVKKGDIDKIAASWVEEWNLRKESPGEDDTAVVERRSFIENAIENKESDPGNDESRPGDKIRKIPLPIRYIFFAAALIAGGVLIIRSLLPNSNSADLFTKYYQPYSAVSMVTRNPSNKYPDRFDLGVEKYIVGDYREAAAMFTESAQNNSMTTQSLFFLGLSQLGQKNGAEAAGILEKVANNSGEYSTDARWYLGLAYLMKNDRPGAIESFRMLAGSKGFYSERSKKILRRLR